MKKYRLDFKGFVLVEAENPHEALSRANYEEFIYKEFRWGDPVEVDK